jgi:hypothetical protein
MKKILVTFLIIAVFYVAASAQAEQPRPTPTPFDSFSDKLYETDWLARLDNMAVEMQNAPDTKAFIVSYGVPNKLPGWPLRRANWARGVLTKGRGIDPTRVEVMFGGYKDEVMYQHWLMRDGERPPVEAFDFAAALTREKTAYKFDQFNLYDPSVDFWGYDGSYSEYLDDRSRYEPLALALRHDPAARACIIAYATRKHRVGTDRRLAMRLKRAVAIAHPVEMQRIVAIGGGLRQYRSVELWIVPPGAELPKPTPTVRPKRRKR